MKKPLYCTKSECLLLTALGELITYLEKLQSSYNRDVSWNDGGSELRSAGDLSADRVGEQRRIHDIPAVHGRSGFTGDSASVEIDGSSSRRTGAQALGGDSWHLSDGPLCVGRKASNIAVW